MRLFLRILCVTFLGCFSLSKSIAQTCPNGYTTASLNWDAMAFLVQDASYVSATIAQNQKFAFGKNQLTISHNYTSVNTFGDNTNHTGSAGSFGNGADVKFRGNGTITLTFETAVQNVNFSLYDIDYNQRVSVSALNGLTAQAITSLSRVSGSLLTISGSGTNTGIATAGNTYVDSTITDATVNINILGPITSITLNITNSATASVTTSNGNGNGNGNSTTTIVEDGTFWLSDISACSVTNPFPSNYRAVAQPLPGQPGYVLVARNNIVYMTDPATGRSVEVFRDPSNQNINSMGYDPYNRILYFTNSLTLSGSANPNNKSLKKYDFNSETLSVVLNDITASLGIPTFGSGVESGGASFYDGALYLGVEGTSSTRSTIWRIDFDGALNPVRARQAFGIALTGHDWGDFVISNGILYDFDGGANGNENVFHLNLQTGAFDATYGSLPFTIRQSSVDWTGQVFNIGGATTGEVAPYNYNGTVNAALQNVIRVGATTPSGSWGDAAEAFRPKVDFGDAPSSYDLNNSMLTFHEIDQHLRLGSTLGSEWNQLSTTNTDTDDDGMNFVPILNQGGGVYQTNVRVFNNTGVNATLGGWMDFNGNGRYDANEGVTVNVPTSGSEQVVSLYWTNIGYNLPHNSRTYLRLRITSASNNMSTANPVGYFADGEVEDWNVLVNVTTLAINLKQFSAENSPFFKSTINWSVEGEGVNTIYELQRSANGSDWNTIHKRNATGNNTYSFVDDTPLMPGSLYRLKYYEVGKPERYSAVQQVLFENKNSFKVYPNPAFGQLTLSLDAIKAELATIRIMDAGGKIVLSSIVQLQKGRNNIEQTLKQISPGIYYVQVHQNDNYYSQKIIIQQK